MRKTQLARSIATALTVVSCLSLSSRAQQPIAGRTPQHAKAVNRLLIRGGMILYGNAKPPFGPSDILIENGLISRVAPRIEAPADAVIDATGKYVLPGFVNTHAHLQDERGGIPQPLQYELNLYLASGVTTLRDVGSDFEKAKRWRSESASHELIAPRIQLYTGIWRARGMSPAFM